MSTATIPQFQLHHRLSLALEASQVSAEAMAVDLGVHVNSVYNYAAGRSSPKLGMIKQWALRTGVPYTWILNGEEPDEGLEQPSEAFAWTGRRLRQPRFLELLAS